MVTRRKEVDVFLEDYAFLINVLNDLSDKTMNFKYKNLLFFRPKSNQTLLSARSN